MLANNSLKRTPEATAIPFSKISRRRLAQSRYAALMNAI
jgi:hypothetical protein